MTTVSANTTLKAGSATGISSKQPDAAGLRCGDVGFEWIRCFSGQPPRGNSTAQVLLGSNTLTLSGSLLTNSGGAETLRWQSGLEQHLSRYHFRHWQHHQRRSLQANLWGGCALLYWHYHDQQRHLAIQQSLGNHGCDGGLNNGGTFLANAANATGSTAAVSLNGTTSTFQINNGFNQSIGSLTGVVNSHSEFARGAGSTTLTITDNGGSPSVFSGDPFSGHGGGAVGGSTKDGSNTLILGGGNNYAGTTTISGGDFRRLQAA